MNGEVATTSETTRDPMATWLKMRDDRTPIGQPIHYNEPALEHISPGLIAQTMSNLVLDLNHKGVFGVSYAAERFDKPGILNGLSRSLYWETGDREPMKKRPEKEITPSDALTAFFEGPTFADCGSTIYATLLRSIEMAMGTIRFNEVFGRPV